METLSAWHEVVRTRNPALLPQLLADDAVFHSPILFAPQQGRDVVALYLTGAMHVLGNDSFRYVREIADDRNAVLEFESTVDGVHVNGVDLITWNDQGLITDFKVMLRPLKAVTVVHQRMADLLSRLS